MSLENVEMVRRSYEAESKEGLWAAAEFAHPEVELVPTPDRPELPVLRGVGSLARQEWLREARRTWGNWWVRVDHMIDAPQDKVVVLSHLCGRSRGTGLNVELELNHVYTVAHGKIAGVEGYFTRKQALEAAGLRE